MPGISLFFSLSDNDVKYLSNYFKAQIFEYKKESTIMTNIKNTNSIGYIIEGEVAVIRYEYNGNRTIIEHLNEQASFGKFLTPDINNDLTIQALENTKIILFDYDTILKTYKSSNSIHQTFLNNIFMYLSNEINTNIERINILSKRSIRDKLLEYFDNLANQALSKNINLPCTYTTLADYLGIDRCAMMRELKNLKDDGLIVTYGKKVILKY